jgi:hypothetical protein
VDQQIGDLLELRLVGEVEDVVAPVVQVIARAPTVQMAVLPAMVPERATDFFALGAGLSCSAMGFFPRSVVVGAAGF